MPKISVFCTKGSTGKTPIAMNIRYDRGYNIATNEAFNVLEDIVPDDEVMAVRLNEPFPTLPDGFDVVFDLAGAISDDGQSIISAISQSDVVIVPINNDFKAIKGGVLSIREALDYNTNIFVVATKLKKQHKLEIIGDDWTKSKDFLDVQEAVHTSVDPSISVLPLKDSAAFDTIFAEDKSIEQICQENPFLRNSFKLPRKQFQAIYDQIDLSTSS